MKGVGEISRTELKFFLSRPSDRLIRSRLSPVLQSDPFSKENGSYLVSSLYYDDWRFSSYYEKEAGVRDRQKIRIRYYNGDPSFIRLEEKAKNGDFSVKSSVRIDRETAENLTLSRIGSGPFSDPLLEIVSRNVRTGAIKPVLFTVYRRTAFRGAVGNLRITLDECVTAHRFRGSLFDPGPGVPVLGGDFSILEIKFNGILPFAVRDLVKDVRKTPSAISKYCMCCDALF